MKIFITTKKHHTKVRKWGVLWGISKKGGSDTTFVLRKKLISLAKKWLDEVILKKRQYHIYVLNVTNHKYIWYFFCAGPGARAISFLHLILVSVV